MKFQMILTILSIAIVLNLISVECSPVREKKSMECSKESIEKANTCAEKLWFAGRHSRRFPENGEQLSKHCKETNDLISCVKDVSDRCGNEIQRQLANVMLFTMKTNDKTYCTKSAKKQEFIALGVCGNRIRDQSSKCMDRFLLMLGKANKYEMRYKVPHACCSFYELKQCIVRSAHNTDHHICNDSSMESLEKYLSSISVNTLNLMCNEYEEESDKCQSIPKLPKGVKYSRALNIIDGFSSILSDVKTIL